MKDAFSLEFGQQFASNESILPSFYGQDLIVFGIQNDIVEAVRLGEKVMSDNGYVLSIQMQRAVKNYLVDNAEKYQKAVKKTGPIDNTSLYRKVSNKDDSVPLFLNVDDPYWINFLESNSKRTQQWRLPSHLAWDHKPHGILGEVIDMKKIIEN